MPHDAYGEQGSVDARVQSAEQVAAYNQQEIRDLKQRVFLLEQKVKQLSMLTDRMA